MEPDLGRVTKRGQMTVCLFTGARRSAIGTNYKVETSVHMHCMYCCQSLPSKPNFTTTATSTGSIWIVGILFVNGNEQAQSQKTISLLLHNVFQFLPGLLFLGCHEGSEDCWQEDEEAIALPTRRKKVAVLPTTLERAL
jgi:hypothetical protein